MALSWDDQLNDLLSQSTTDSEAIEVAEACRTESDDECGASSVWWAPLLKSHLCERPAAEPAHDRPETQVLKLVSACCGYCSEAETLQAGDNREIPARPHVDSTDMMAVKLAG